MRISGILAPQAMENLGDLARDSRLRPGRTADCCLARDSRLGPGLRIATAKAGLPTAALPEIRDWGLAGLPTANEALPRQYALPCEFGTPFQKKTHALPREFGVPSLTRMARTPRYSAAPPFVLCERSLHCFNKFGTTDRFGRESVRDARKIEQSCSTA